MLCYAVLKIVLLCRTTGNENVQLETPGQTKAPTNPVYSEITDVSAIDPVYTDIDRRKPLLPTFVNIFGQEDTGAYEVPDFYPGKVNMLRRVRMELMIRMRLTCQGMKRMA